MEESTTESIQKTPDLKSQLNRLLTSYGNAMYRKDPDAAEIIYEKFQALLSSMPCNTSQPETEQRKVSP